MIRTKDFVVILIACLLITIGAGFFFVSGGDPPEVFPSDDIYFEEPQSGYTIVPYTSLRTDSDRNAFIENVRRAYVPQESPISEPMPQPQEEEVHVSPAETRAPEESVTPEIFSIPTSTPSAHMSTTTGTMSLEASADTGSSI